jgi:hypothetical protein
MEHRFTEIDPHSLTTSNRCPKSYITSAATDIQGGCATGDSRQVNEPPLPPPVQTKALQIVYQIITERYLSKQLAYLLGPPVAWFIEWICHADGFRFCRLAKRALNVKVTPPKSLRG